MEDLIFKPNFFALPRTLRTQPEKGLGKRYRSALVKSEFCRNKSKINFYSSINYAHKAPVGKTMVWFGLL